MPAMRYLYGSHVLRIKPIIFLQLGQKKDIVSKHFCGK